MNDKPIKISVCIPQYNRCQHILEVIDSIDAQDYPYTELVISDDASTDGSSEKIIQRLKHFKHENKYSCLKENRGYDVNLRASMAMATGDYIILLGNDDALADEDSLSRLAQQLQRHNLPEVCFSNFYASKAKDQVQRRALETKIVGWGPNVAVKAYRSFSFVAGLVYKTAEFKKHDTDKYDTSVYFQVYLACRILAAGGRLLTLDEPLFVMAIQIEGANAKLNIDCDDSFEPIHGGQISFTKVACEAILKFGKDVQKKRWLTDIYAQIYTATLPFWIFELRRRSKFKTAVGLVRGCSPKKLVYSLEDVNVKPNWYKLYFLYAFFSFFCLILPVKLFLLLKDIAYKWVKRI